jgi:predicted permease
MRFPGASVSLDLRYGIRLLRKSPGSTLVSVLALAIGIGASVTLFGFVNALLLRPVDAVEPDRLVRADAGGTELMNFIRYADYLQYRDRNQSLSSLAAFYPGWMAEVRIDGPAGMIAVTPVSGNYFETLGVTAARGRTLAAADDEPGAPRSVVLSDAGFRRHFGADERVLGRIISIDRQPFTVVGVMPSSFEGTVFPNIPQIYAPFHARGVTGEARAFLIGRLKPGISMDEARADLSRIAASLAKETGHPKSIGVHAGTAIFPQFVRFIAPLVALFAAVVAAVLWIACGNVAVLLLARAAARRREIEIRRALGASRPRLIRQILVESAVLATAGGLGAIAVSLAISSVLTRFYLPVPMPIALTFHFDSRVAAFAVGVSFAACLLFGLGPALRSSSIAIARSSRSGPGLVVTQVALSTLLLATAGLFVKSLSAPQDRGFTTDGVLMATVRLTGPAYTPETSAAFSEEVLRRLESDSGISSVTAAESVPLAGIVPLSERAVEIEIGGPSADSTLRRIFVSRVSRNHFRTLGIPLLSGRDFSPADDADAPGIGIVNETLARRFWPGRSPIGERLDFESGPSIEVVGLARDSKYRSLEEEPMAVLYRPLAQEPVATITLLARTTLGPRAAALRVRDEVASFDPYLVVYNLQALEERIGLGLLAHRALAWVAGVLGILALLLGALGTYGLVSFLVEERRREIGVRLALGATPSRVVSLSTRRGMRWSAAGASLGLSGAFALARLLESHFRGLSADDPIPMAGAALLLFTATWVACFLPARRASRADVMSALRE